jgi:O-antigen/teichoic acid export membrane protein
VGIRARSWRYFVSAAATAAISLLTLPLTTRVLGPRDYGILALGTVVAGAGAVLAVLGTSYLLARRWFEAGAEARTRLVSTLVLSGTTIALAWAAAVALAYVLLRGSVATIAAVPGWGLALLLIGTATAAPWLVASEVLTLEGRASLFSATAIAQAIATAAVTLVALFVFDLGTLSLFVGVFAGGLVALVVGVYVLRAYLAPAYDGALRRELAQRTFLPAQLTESAQPFLERVLLSRFAGFADLGLYSHSQRYFALGQAVTKSVGRGVWPVSLAEARDVAGDFPATRRTWNALHVTVTAGAIALTLLGDFAVSLLTNDKFTDAAVFFAPWSILLLLQLSAKPEVATLFAHASGESVARISVLANLAALAATAALVPLFGTGGAAAALLTQAVVYRIAVRVPSRRYRSVPFQDRWALLGIAVVAAAFVAKLGVGGDLGESLLVLAGIEAAWLTLSRRVLGETLQALHVPRLRRGPARA